MTKKQLHKRITERYLNSILNSYLNQEITAKEGAKELDISLSLFYDYSHLYKLNPLLPLLQYKLRKPRRRFLPKQHKIIKEYLEDERKRCKKYMGRYRWNFSHLSDLFKEKYKFPVADTTLRKYATQYGLYKPRKHRRKKAYAKFERGCIGELLQLDASTHNWCPNLLPFTIIVIIDDHSRKILDVQYADVDNSWDNIELLTRIVFTNGRPLSIYVDKHSIYGYDKTTLRYSSEMKVDEQKQFKRICNLLGIQLVYANSPQAKGKIESKFAFLQNRVMRICAMKEVNTIEETMKIIKSEIQKYNRKIHSNTSETPSYRYKAAYRTGKTKFTPLSEEQKENFRDIFCLEYFAKSDEYGYVKWRNHIIKTPLKSTKFALHYRLNRQKGVYEIRLCSKGLLAVSKTYRLKPFQF